jgi:hypothetical protein
MTLWQREKLLHRGYGPAIAFWFRLALAAFANTFGSTLHFSSSNQAD